MKVRDKLRKICIDHVRDLDDEGLMEFHEWYTGGKTLVCDICRLNQGGECKLDDCPPASVLLDQEFSETKTVVKEKTL